MQCPVVGRCITVLTKIDVQGAGVVDGVGGTGGTVRRGRSLPLVLIVFFGLVGCADDGVGPSDTVPTTSEVTSETPPPTASSGPNRIVPIPTPSALASEHSEVGAIAFNVLGDDARLPVRDSGCRAIPGGSSPECSFCASVLEQEGRDEVGYTYLGGRITIEGSVVNSFEVKSATVTTIVSITSARGGEQCPSLESASETRGSGHS